MRLSLFAVALGCCVVGGAAVQAASVQSALAQAAKPKYVSAAAQAAVKVVGGGITIDYCAPQAHGRTIFGGLVPYGEVWRTGANAATTMKTDVALQIGNLNVPAGTYTLYSLPTADGWTLIVNKQNGQWGTVYDKAQDFGRVPMSATTTATPVETFVIDFEKTVGPSTELHLKWAGVDASVQINAVK
jgi:hypothetical protein